MMHRYFLLVFLLPFISITAQNQRFETIIDSLEKNQLLFEKVFIHTNKTRYSIKDVVWFKAYVAKNNNTPSTKTTLLHVSLFAKEGRLIKSKKIYIKEGVGSNQFILDDSLSAGQYIIQAYTNNMLNFGEENKFVTEITIGESLKKETAPSVSYDIQFFPEGGYFLEGVNNVVGVKALINGKGCEYTGKIVDQAGIAVTSFSSKYLGMTKSQFIYKKNETYKAVIKVNDTLIEKALPAALKDGLALSKVYSSKDIIKIELLTNKQTRLKDVVLLFHQNNKVIDYLNVDFKGQHRKVFAFNKKDFLKGVNTITVLTNNKPVLERKFFVEGLVFNEFSVEELNKQEDSIIYQLKLKDIKTKSNISLSVLNSDYSYSSPTDIVSAMHLTPYVKGYIENPSYYFNNANVNREAYLDLLLLTQGWTQYSQTQFLEIVNPKGKHNFETGFVLEGSVAPVLTNNLGLFTLDDQLITKQFLSNQTVFSFKDLVAYKGDSVKLAFIDREVLRKKPKKIKFDTIHHKKDKLSHSFNIEFLKDIQQRKKEPIAVERSYAPTLDGVIGLENVALNTRKKSKAVLDRKAFDKEHRKEVFDIGAYYELDIPEKYSNDNMVLKEYLYKERGLWIWRSDYGWEALIKGFKWNEYGFKLPQIVMLTIDGASVSSYRKNNSIPWEVAMDMDMKYIQDAMYQPGAFKHSPDELAVFTTDDYKKGITNNFTTYVFDEGFDKSKSYYTPLYSGNSGVKNQEIDWKPNLIVNTNGEVVFKIKEDNNVQALLFSVQGFSNQGELISGFYTLETNKIN